MERLRQTVPGKWAGFAVVAGEVRKLAEQVNHSATDIKQIIKRIDGEFSHVTGSLQSSYIKVEEGKQQITVTEEKFAAIHQRIEEMTMNIHMISNAFNIHNRKRTGIWFHSRNCCFFRRICFWI